MSALKETNSFIQKIKSLLNETFSFSTKDGIENLGKFKVNIENHPNKDLTLDRVQVSLKLIKPNSKKEKYEVSVKFTCPASTANKKERKLLISGLSNTIQQTLNSLGKIGPSLKLKESSGETDSIEIIFIPLIDLEDQEFTTYFKEFKPTDIRSIIIPILEYVNKYKESQEYLTFLQTEQLILRENELNSYFDLKKQQIKEHHENYLDSLNLNPESCDIETILIHEKNNIKEATLILRVKTYPNLKQTDEFNTTLGWSIGLLNDGTFEYNDSIVNETSDNGDEEEYSIHEVNFNLDTNFQNTFNLVLEQMSNRTIASYPYEIFCSVMNTLHMLQTKDNNFLKLSYDLSYGKNFVISIPTNSLSENTSKKIQNIQQGIRGKILDFTNEFYRQIGLDSILYDLDKLHKENLRSEIIIPLDSIISCKCLSSEEILDKLQNIIDLMEKLNTSSKNKSKLSIPGQLKFVSFPPLHLNQNDTEVKQPEINFIDILNGTNSITKATNLKLVDEDSSDEEDFIFNKVVKDRSFSKPAETKPSNISNQLFKPGFIKTLESDTKKKKKNAPILPEIVKVSDLDNVEIKLPEYIPGTFFFMFKNTKLAVIDKDALFKDVTDTAERKTLNGLIESHISSLKKHPTVFKLPIKSSSNLSFTDGNANMKLKSYIIEKGIREPNVLHGEQIANAYDDQSSANNDTFSAPYPVILFNRLENEMQLYIEEIIESIYPNNDYLVNIVADEHCNRAFVMPRKNISELGAADFEKIMLGDNPFVFIQKDTYKISLHEGLQPVFFHDDEKIEGTNILIYKYEFAMEHYNDKDKARMQNLLRKKP